MIICMISNYFLSLMSVLTMGYLIFYKCGIKRGMTPFFSIGIILFFEFLFGCIQMLSTGTFLLYVFLIGYSCYVFLKQRKYFFSYLKSDSICFFISVSVLWIVFYITTNKYFITWDEYSHWGPFAKAIKESNVLHIYNISLDFVHPSYQEGEALLYYFFSFFYPQYEEYMIFAAYAIVLTSCLAPLFDLTERWKKRHKFLLMLIAPFFYRIFATMSPYTCIYCDVMLGAIAGCIAGYIVAKEHIVQLDILFISISMVFLTQIKDIGFLYAIICCVLLFVKLLFKKKNDLKKGIMYVIPLLVILCIKIYWSFLIRITNNNTDQFTNISFSNIINGCLAFFKGNDPYFREVINYVYDAFLHRTLSFLDFATSKNLVLCFVFVTVFLIIKNRRNIVICIQLLVFPLAAIGYLIILFLVYRFTMSPSEMEIVNSFERYYGSMLLMWALLLLYICVYWLTDYYKDLKTFKMLISGILCFSLFIEIYDITYNDALGLKTSKILTGRQPLENMCSDINLEIGKEKATILILGTDISHYNMYRYHYQLMPHNVKYQFEENYWLENDIEHYVLKFDIDYIVIANCNEIFRDKYEKLLGEELNNLIARDYIGAIYKVAETKFYFLKYIFSDIQ